MKRLLHAVLFSLLPAAALSAQTIVVDPGGGGQFTDLQTAINAAPSGAILRVIGGTWSNITIDKSLTIIGDPAPTISSPRQASGIQPAGIELRGTGVERLVLRDVVVGGTVTFPANGPGPGIDSVDFAEIRLHNCDVSGHEYEPISLTGSVEGAPALQAGGTTAPFLLLVESELQGSISWSDFGAAIYNAPQGPAGVDAPSATLVAIDSTITGGRGGESVVAAPPSATLCPCTALGGQGGDAVIVESYFEGGFTRTISGEGGIVMVRAYGSGPSIYWGAQPSGLPVRATNIHTLGFRIDASAPLALGQTRTLQVNMPRAGVLLIGEVMPPQGVFGTQWLLVDPSSLAAVIALPNHSTSLTQRVPNNPALAGFEIGFQAASSAIGRIFLSVPRVDVIGF